MFGTDSLYAHGMMSMTHPRAIGTFPKILGQCVREKGLLSLEQAIYKMTGLPAKRYGLKGKGTMSTGQDADLVIFDPSKIGQQCTYSQPLLPNTGISYVFVGGRIAVERGKTTGERQGRVIRRRI